MGFVLNIGIVLSFFLGILLFSKKDKALTDNILSVWLITIGIHLTGYFLNYKGYWDIYPHLIGITAPFPFLCGPFLYLYVTYSIKSKSYLQKSDYLHFAPALISYLCMAPFYFFYSVGEKIQVDKGLIDDYSVFSTIMLIGFILSGIIYSVLSYRNSNLTLAELAQRLSIPTNHLSQIINQYEQVNYFEFVNKFRVEEFIQNVHSNKSYSLLGHAYDSGFNSKSTFNIAFKKCKSVTPSQYFSVLKTS